MMHRFIVTFVFIAVIGFSDSARALSDNIYQELDVFSRIIELVDKEYVNDVDEHRLMSGAINGMLSSLDPHSMYLTPEMYKNFKSDTEGKFGGIGIEVTVKNGLLTVVSPIEGTPADLAGIKSGDRIVKIDGESAKNISLYGAVQRMRGPHGKKIILGIWREGFTEPRDFIVERQVIRVKSVKTEILADGVVFIRIVSFQENTADELKKNLKSLEEEHGEAFKGIILDLRDNPGGLLTESVYVSDIFIDKGVIVSTRGRNRKPEVQMAKHHSHYEELPMAVLVNRGSASAAEIVAGALQDTHRARIFGTTSFGKGSVQTLMELGNKAALKLTIAHYYTPKGRSIDGKGIEPDTEVSAKDWDRAYPGKKEEDRLEFREYQKQVALNYLQNK